MTEPVVPDTVTDIAYELNAPAPGGEYAQLRQGTVQAINASDNTASIYLSGDTSVLITGVHFFNSFQPTVGDTIWLGKQGTDLIGIGKVGTGTFNSYGQIQGIPFNNVILAGNTGWFDLSAVPNSTSITKRYSTSNLFINLSVTGWCDVASGTLQVAAQIGFTDYICGSVNLDMLIDTGGDTDQRTARIPAVGSTVVTGLGAGAHTVKIRIRNPTGTGNLHVDGGDFYTMTVQEVL